MRPPLLPPSFPDREEHRKRIRSTDKHTHRRAAALRYKRWQARTTKHGERLLRPILKSHQGPGQKHAGQYKCLLNNLQIQAEAIKLIICHQSRVCECVVWWRGGPNKDYMMVRICADILRVCGHICLYIDWHYLGGPKTHCGVLNATDCVMSMSMGMGQTSASIH